MVHPSKASTEAVLGQERVPTLIVMGSLDPDQDDPAAEAAWIAQRSGGRVVMVQGVGRDPHVEIPSEVGPEIVTFLRSLKQP